MEKNFKSCKITNNKIYPFFFHLLLMRTTYENFINLQLHYLIKINNTCMFNVYIDIKSKKKKLTSSKKTQKTHN